ncbi:MAG: FAD-dependent oxidoreductase [Alphaproteobacteria bacterium]|nr:FAD-dependent oxidoreductase [Alphaproteobacteria bacterium]MDE6570677.1 FAD-dependent oxidoreductase [Alphaproteobacteria bacterium]
MLEMYDVIILGSGPAGLTAALYCARANKKTLVLGGDRLGGQTAGIAVLENYPGWAGSGLELSEFMKKQAETFGAEVVFASAKNISGDAETGFNVLCDNDKRYVAKTVIIATGASPRKLEIDGARELMGKGVSYCATCDGFFYTDKTVIVLGGGNSALNDALYLADIAKTVKIVYRKGAFTRAEAVLRNRVSERDNIECLFNTDLKKIAPAADSDQLVVTTTDDAEMVVDGIFVAIGHEANTDYLTEDVRRDHMGRLIPAELPAGMFVAGDVQSEIKMQIATAVGTGCSAAMDAIAYLNTKN